LTGKQSKEDVLTWLAHLLKSVELKFENLMKKSYLQEKYDAKRELEQFDSLLIPASPEAFQPTPKPSLTVPGQ